MHTDTSIDSTRTASRTARQSGQVVGVVPTMGALHAGHVSLMQAAREECDFVIATIFVNPTQFGPNEDFDQYPRTLNDDLEQCRAAGVDFVFHPNVEAMYPPGAETFVEVEHLSRHLEGRHRSGHFRGVTTVVLKLFNITEPDLAFFGQKDYQQQLLIRKMCQDLDVPVTIRTCPIIRERDGLAMSSRNRYLSPNERERALRLSQSLEIAQRELKQRSDVAAITQQMENHLTAGDLQVDYTRLVDPETLCEVSAPQPVVVALVAARVGTTRLIDNAIITLQEPVAEKNHTT